MNIRVISKFHAHYVSPYSASVPPTCLLRFAFCFFAVGGVDNIKIWWSSDNFKIWWSWQH